MAENISPNVPNIEPPVVPADLEPAPETAQKAESKGKSWKFWVGSVLGTLIVAGGIFAGIFYSGQTNLFKGAIDLTDLSSATVNTLNQDVIKLDLAFINVYDDGSFNDYSRNLTFVVDHNITNVVPDAVPLMDSKIDPFLMIYDEANIDATLKLITLDELIGANTTIINWQPDFDIFTNFAKPVARIVFIDQSGTNIEYYESNEVILNSRENANVGLKILDINMDPILGSTTPIYNVGSNEEFKITVAKIGVNSITGEDVLNSINSLVTETNLVVSLEGVELGRKVVGINFALNSALDVKETINEIMPDIIAANGSGDYQVHIEYIVDTQRNGFLCDSHDGPGCITELQYPEEVIESNIFTIISEKETINFELAPISCEMVDMTIENRDVFDEFNVGGNYPIKFKIDNTNSQPIQYKFLIDNIDTVYPTGVNPFSTTADGIDNVLNANSSVEHVVNFEPTILGPHTLVVNANPVADSVFETECANWNKSITVDLPVGAPSNGNCPDVITITEGTSNTIAPQTGLSTTYQNSYTITNTSTTDTISVSLELNNNTYTNYRWEINGEPESNLSKTINLAPEADYNVVVYFDSPEAAEAFSDVSLLVTQNGLDNKVCRTIGEFDLSTSSEAVQCAERLQKVVDELYRGLPVDSDPGYQSAYSSFLGDLDARNEDFSQCNIPSEPAACTVAQQEAMDAIFRDADLDDPTDSSYESDFEDYLDEVEDFPEDCDREEIYECPDDLQDEIDEAFDDLIVTESSYSKDYNLLVDEFSDDEYANCTIPDKVTGDDPEEIVQTQADILTQIPVNTPIIPDTRPVAPVQYGANVTGSPNIQGSTGPGLLVYPVMIGMASVFARRRKED